MVFCVPLAVEVSSKETEDTLVFRSAACMQIAVLPQGRKTACNKEMSSPDPQKSPEKAGTHNIFPIVPGFFSLLWPIPFKLRVVSVSDLKNIHLSQVFIAFCCYLSFQNSLSEFPSNPPLFSSPVLLFFYGLFPSSGLT